MRSVCVIVFSSEVHISMYMFLTNANHMLFSGRLYNTGLMYVLLLRNSNRCRIWGYKRRPIITLVSQFSHLTELIIARKGVTMTHLLSLIVVSLLPFGFVSATGVPSKILRVLPDANTSSILECAHMEDIDSCEKIDIDFEAMSHASEVMLTEDGIVFKRSAFEVAPSYGEGHVFSFEGPDFSFAVLTYTEEPGYPDINGRFYYTKDDSSYMIDNCGKDCHVLIKLGKKSTEIEEPEEIPSSRAILEEDLDPEVKQRGFCRLSNLHCK